MKKMIVSAMIAVMGVALIPGVADAKRFGGGGSSGMKRSIPTQPSNAVPPRPAQTPQQNPATPGQAAAPAAGTAAAAAAAPRRSWMGPVAGLAAGLGLAALASHLGFGEGLANILTIVLLAGLAFFVIRLLMRKFAGGSARGMADRSGLQMAGAGAGTAGFGREASPAASPFGQPVQARTASRSEPAFTPAALPPSSEPFAARDTSTPMSAAAGSIALPADFDAEAFERIAKMIFIRMQAANDAGDVEDLRQFTTPEMFAAARVDLQDRHGSAQRTDVVQLQAHVLDVAQEPSRQIVSVRYHGLIREENDAPAHPFDEVWHLVKPNDGSREWAIAGVQQLS